MIVTGKHTASKLFHTCPKGYIYQLLVVAESGGGNFLYLIPYYNRAQIVALRESTVAHRLYLIAEVNPHQMIIS